MSETTRQALKRLLAAGTERAWAVRQLTDLCPKSKAEINVLEQALPYITVFDRAQHATPQILASVALSLAQTTGRDAAQCSWAAETWAFAMDILPLQDMTTPATMPLPNSQTAIPGPLPVGATAKKTSPASALTSSRKTPASANTAVGTTAGIGSPRRSARPLTSPAATSSLAVPPAVQVPGISPAVARPAPASAPASRSLWLLALCIVLSVLLIPRVAAHFTVAPAPPPPSSTGAPTPPRSSGVSPDPPSGAARTAQARAEEAKVLVLEGGELLDTVKAQQDGGRKDPQQENTLLNKAEVKLKGALKLCDEAIQLDPETKLAYFERAKALQYSGEDKQALKAVQAGLSRFPTDTELRVFQKHLQNRLANGHRP